jgi:predicted transposase/invertase (TIGR01784 family)
MKYVDVTNDIAFRKIFGDENRKGEGLITAFDQANKHNWTKQELEDYNKVFIREADEKGRLELAEKRGEAKGKLDAAKSLKKLGVAIETIMEATGLTKAEIEKL